MKPKAHLTLHLQQWDVYKLADFTVAFILVVVSLAEADIPRRRIEIVRKPAPYVARGWTSEGEQLNLPLRATPPTPAASYGPPEVEVTTEEPEATTESAEAQKSENLETEPEKEKVEAQQFYLVLSQGQNLVYTIPRSAALVAVPKSDLVARIEALPFSSAMASSVFTPFSASYIQIYQ